MSALRVLIVEDSEDDAQLLVRELERAGYELMWERVETAETMRSALHRGAWDIVISDFAMPSFSARGALDVLHQSGLDLPFIIISGTVGEDVAVEALKAGAHDFLVKGRFARLVPVIERERREALSRRGRQDAERALRTSEARYRTIVETAQEGIWTLDTDGRTTYLNQRMAEMLGSTVEEMASAPFLDFVDTEWKDKAGRIVEESAPGVTDILFRRRDDSEFWGAFSISPISDQESQRIGTLAMIVDTTQQRQLHAQLMMSDRMVSVGMLAAGVAHEINNPLAAVLFQLDIALHHLAEVPGDTPNEALVQRIQKSLEHAREASGRVRDIVQDLRIFSRGNEEKSGPVDLHAILESTARLAWNEIRHRARLTTQYGPPVLVEGNESRLGQVFLNLVINSAQAIQEGAAPANEIRIATSVASDNEVMVEVSDTGSGMSPDILRRLFVPFFTTKPVGVGTGLGLSICQRIVTSFGGRMTVNSTLGKGTSVRVFLPIAPPTHEDDVAGSEIPASPREGQHGRALIIDDDALVLESLGEGIALEHEVKLTTSARTALDWIRAGERFDVILCDVMMPSIGGQEFYAELAKFAPDQLGRIVFLTGGAFTPQAQTFFDKIPNPKLSKPASLDDVLNTIRAVLDRGQPARPVRGELH